MSRLLIALFVLALASPAWSQAASTWNTRCDGSGGVVTDVKSPSMACYYFEALGVVDSDEIECKAQSCLFRFDPDDSTDGAGTATVWIRGCNNNQTFSDLQCPRIHGAALTGVCGDPTTQLCQIRVGPGFYYVEVVGDGVAGDDPFVSITAE